MQRNTTNNVTHKAFGIFHKSTVALGMLEFVLPSFNAYLSMEAEKLIDKKWEVRQAHFNQMGVRFGVVCANVRTTQFGSKYKAVIKFVLGVDLSLVSLFLFCNLLSQSVMTRILQPLSII